MKIKRFIIVYGFFVSLIFASLMLFTMTRWYYHYNNDQYSIKIEEVKQPYEKISNPQADKYYFRKVEITKITKCKNFPFLETTVTEVDKGGWQRDK